jgi:hypothetical protein
MNNTIVFSETQRFRQWWLWLILIAVNGPMLYGLFSQLILGRPFGNHPADNYSLLIATLSTLLVSLLFLYLRLETQITTDGIYVRFFPFRIRFRHYPWREIRRSYVREYSPLGEYGGWGIRFGFAGRGKALNVSGNKGLQLLFIDNSRLLIGTSHPEELARALASIGHLTDAE